MNISPASSWISPKVTSPCWTSLDWIRWLTCFPSWVTTWCKWLKDNILDVLKHGRTESTTARPWYSPRPCSHPGSIPAKYPVLCIQFANLLVGKLLIFLYGFVAFEVSFQANQEACQSESDKSFNKGLNLRLSRFACLLHGLGDWTDSPPKWRPIPEFLFGT